ncbi:hypothetical protein GCM10010885_08550 [Alicyclobacillus cellulosilyticus]|uniref:Uncharacterized protein n=1 Tax=Alicyclobacillus cellulosilyticus TaxID=1003997 RepID=A0A917NHU7_9BACL|nr:DUF6054 family protein [Alicyclobacillus cellulosilyticus]GGJ01649.1 hypothetical protein GCM10010885_08550 [Alicyclobacillus cellulosilyticus]
MAKLEFSVQLPPADALAKVRDNLDADLVHEELHDLGGGRGIGTLIFERYFFRTKNRAALIVIADNLSGTTQVRAIATGSSEGLIFNLDWGAADDFVEWVADILREDVIG